MNVVYLIGNGFDISLGLNTRYLDFYNYYLNTESKSSVVKEFKDTLRQEIDKWSDFELELGGYIDKIDGIGSYNLLIRDIRLELSKYLEEVQNYCRSDIISSIKPDEFLAHLCNPEKYLRRRDSDDLVKFYKQIGHVHHIYNVINFNYTNTIEQVLGIKKESNEHLDLNFTTHRQNTSKVLVGLYHVHGSVRKDMVLGVNDDWQVKGHNLIENQSFRRSFIKNECNFAQRHGIEEKCQQIINEADVICIFGSSLGETDRCWWEIISKKVKNGNCKLVVFVYDDSYLDLNGFDIIEYRSSVINCLFGESLSSDIDDKVVVNINSGLFSF